MELINDLKQRYIKLDILSQFIVVIISCFIIPFIINTFLFLFNLKGVSVIDFFEVSPSLSELLYKVFVLCLLSGSVTYLLSYNIFPVFNGLKPSMIGASAGVMSVFIFLAFYNPHYTFRLIVFDVKIMYLALMLIALDLIQIPIGNSGGHLAHLGGAAWGFYYCSQIKQGRDTGQWVLNFIEYLKRFFSRKNKVNKVYERKNSKTSSKSSLNQQKIDLILDKISKSGYDSLTKSEKDTLFKAGDN